MKSTPASRPQVASGFKHLDTTYIRELNISLLRYRHLKTGARYLHIEADDDNNMFGIGFKTTPHDSSGVAHILEHTVLCGSRKYPVRDPFFSMIRRSLNTFMNALTASDWTLYPFATRNQTDFYNLMGVYLDAVFYPLLREIDFSQEGHRLEFSSPLDSSTPLEIKGVVFNEMKGAMADPSSLLSRRLNQALYPHTTYGNNSGGEPSEIPSLTHAELVNFHKRYYHPTNSYMCSYGNLPVEKHLAFIEENVLSNFDACDVDSSVPKEDRYTSPQKFNIPYPLDPGESSAKRTMVQLGWLAAPIENREDNTALNVLASLLIGNPSTPLYKALLNSGLGLNLAPGTGFHDDLRESFFAAGLQGTEHEHVEKIEQLIQNTLQECIEKGFSQQQIDAATHQLEFSFREVGGDSYPYGLTLLIRLLASWLHTDDPITPLRSLERYESIRKTARKSRLFEKIIQRYLLENPHRVTLALYPDKNLQAQQEKDSREKLARIESSLTSEQVERLIHNAETLATNQEDPGEVEKLPTLEIKDIPSQEPEVKGITFNVESTSCWEYAQPTNGIAYVTLRFDLSALEKELIPFVPLFAALLPQVGAAGEDYLTISDRIASTTGGIRAHAQVIENPGEQSGFFTCLEVRGKSLYRNYTAMLKLLNDLLTSADFSDYERVNRVINQVRISMENGIPASGHSYAVKAASSSLPGSGKLKESWSGIEQLRLIRQWADHPTGELASFAEKMHRIAEQLVNRNHLRLLLSAEPNQIELLKAETKSFVLELPLKDVASRDNFTATDSKPSNKGWIANSPVAYVARVFPTVPYAHPDAPSLAVLSRLLRAGYLHREIRERGGAYGGLVSNDPMASLLSMVSYRDPHISRTLTVFHDAAKWAFSGEFSDDDIKEAILSCFAEIDRPNSPAGRAYREFNCLEQGLTREVRQAYREGILAVTRERLVFSAKKYLLDNWSKSAVAVLAGEEMITREMSRVNPALSLEKI